MKKLKAILTFMTTVFVLTACDEHEIVDLSWHAWSPGMVYTSNGDVCSYEKCKEDGNTPEAVIFYVDNNDEISGKAYAVALKDCESGAFSDPDTIYVAQGTTANYGGLDGEANTTTLRYADIASPIAKNVDAKYFIPSVGEMYKLYIARGVVNAVLQQCGGDILPIDDNNCWYWTSTEQNEAQTDRAWRFSLYSGRFESADKHQSYPTRPIMMIRLNKAEQQ